MDGAQDMGGVQGFGPVMPEPTTRYFTPSGKAAFSR